MSISQLVSIITRSIRVDTWQRNNARRGQDTMPHPLAAPPLRPAKRAPPTLLETRRSPPTPLPPSLHPSIRLSLHPSPSLFSFRSHHLPSQAPLEAEGSRRVEAEGSRRQPLALSCDVAAKSPPLQVASGFSWPAVTRLARCLFFFLREKSEP
jgi:hypothetical protein